MMKIRGTAANPGFVTPNIEKICQIHSQYRPLSSKASVYTYTKNDDEKEVDVGNVVELKVQILWDEAERRVLGRPDLVARIVL